MRINQSIKQRLDDIDSSLENILSNGIQFIGLSKDGLYLYQKQVGENTITMPVNPHDWEDIKIAFEHAVKLEKDPAWMVKRLKLSLAAKGI